MLRLHTKQRVYCRCAGRDESQTSVGAEPARAGDLACRSDRTRDRGARCATIAPLLHRLYRNNGVATAMGLQFDSQPFIGEDCVGEGLLGFFLDLGQGVIVM